MRDMLHPIGSQPPGVYWRRRFVLLTSVVVLVVLTALVLRSGGGDSPASAAGRSSGAHHPATGSSSAPAASHDSTDADGAATLSTPSATQSTSRHVKTSTSGHASGHSSAAPPPPAACTTKQLAVSAAVAKSSYQVGDDPVVMLQVEDTGPTPCVQDLADSQVELRVYNGESRVWGSHDCEVQPGVDKRTLAVGQPVRVSITWSGLSSQPGCKGTRQRVGAGSYTLYAALGTQPGKAAQFSIS
jgi:hypothetical protein